MGSGSGGIGATALHQRFIMVMQTSKYGKYTQRYYGFGHDEFSWLGAIYSAGELISMPFSAWFAVTLSLRRFHLSMLTLSALLAGILPFIHSLELLLAVRFIQGVSSGTLIPMLVMSALKYLPPAMRLHAFALYALTATFSPNIALWLTEQLLTVMLLGLSLPMGWLDQYQDYRALQIVPIVLMLAVQQPIIGSLVALLLYRRWEDARMVFSLGLVFIAISCRLGSYLTSEWMWYVFIGIQTIQAIAQPMAVVAMLFLMTSVVRPSEGRYVSGAINTVRLFGKLLGSSLITPFITVRGRFHTEMLINQSAFSYALLPHSESVGSLNSVYGHNLLC